MVDFSSHLETDFHQTAVEDRLGKLVGGQKQWGNFQFPLNSNAPAPRMAWEPAASCAPGYQQQYWSNFHENNCNNNWFASNHPEPNRFHWQHRPEPNFLPHPEPLPKNSPSSSAKKPTFTAPKRFATEPVHDDNNRLKAPTNLLSVATSVPKISLIKMGDGYKRWKVWFNGEIRFQPKHVSTLLFNLTGFRATCPNRTAQPNRCPQCPYWKLSQQP